MPSYSLCKSQPLVASAFRMFANRNPRIDDETALRAKVDEALTVYDEYMKNKGEGDPAEPPPGAKEAPKEAEAEETKS